VIQKPDASHYELLVLEILASLGPDFSYCRGQTYDNAAIMSGERSGLQKRLLDRNPKATFLNCDNHSLNLAASHAAEMDPSVVTFFGTVNEVFVFSHSPTALGQNERCLQEKREDGECNTLVCTRRGH
jgi:hypothetical protein